MSCVMSIPCVNDMSCVMSMCCNESVVLPGPPREHAHRVHDQQPSKQHPAPRTQPVSHVSLAPPMVHLECR